MALQLRRGPNSLRTTITPEPGEPLWTTDTNALYVGDGVTPGGVAITAVINTATSSVVGGVKIGSGVNISADGTISVNTGGGFTADQSLNTNSNVTFNQIVVGDGNSVGNIFSKGAQNLLLTANDTLSVGGRINILSGESNGVVIGNHNTTQILTVNTVSGVSVSSPFAIQSDRFYGVSNAGQIYFGDGNNAVFLRPRGAQNLRLTPENGVGGYFEVQSGEAQGLVLGNHYTNSIMTINTATGVNIANAVFNATTASFSGELAATALANNTTSNILYYNNGNGQITYGPAPAGGGSLQTDQALFTTSSVTFKDLTLFDSVVTATLFREAGQEVYNLASSRTLWLEATTGRIEMFGALGTRIGSGWPNPDSILEVDTINSITSSTLRLNAANVGLNNVLLTNNSKIVTTATTYNQNIEIWNSSGTNTDHSTLRFYRQRGGAAPQANAVLGAIQVDGWQTTNGYASAYAANRRFPGISIEALANFGADSAPTQFRVLNRGAFLASNPFPYNQTAQNTTDTTVIESLYVGPSLSRLKSSNFNIYDPFQGWDILNSAGASSRAVFGANAFAAFTDAAGNAILLRPSTAYSTTTNEYPQAANNGIVVRNRTDHIAYWNQFVGGLNTSTQGQINWVSAASTANWVSPTSGSSVVKGANIALNSTRYQRGAFNIARGTASTSTSYLWNTSTQAGDVLGTISFQGGLNGSAIANQLDGAVDGILIRAYAVNNWEGEQSSTTTDVTYSLNESAIRIEHATTTTIGGASASAAGLQQKYSTLVEFGKTTSTFYTAVALQGPVTAAELTVNSATITVNNIAVGFTATGITLNGTEFTGSGGTPYAITRQEVTGNTTLSTSTALFVLATGAGGYTVTLPQTTGVTGVQEIRIKNKTTGTLTIATSNSELIDDDATLILEQPNSSVILTSNTSSWAIF